MGKIQYNIEFLSMTNVNNLGYLSSEAVIFFYMETVILSVINYWKLMILLKYLPSMDMIHTQRCRRKAHKVSTKVYRCLYLIYYT